MSRSAEEQEIRDAVVSHLRTMFPDARIIHELNVNHGNGRIDVVAVTTSRIISVEIKSERDTLKRLRDQITEYGQCSDVVIAAVHQKFFEQYDHNNGSAGWKESADLRDKARNAVIWCYPKIDTSTYIGRWDIAKYHWKIPDTKNLLYLMWADELRVFARHAGLSITSRTPAYELHRLLWNKQTGEEIKKAVCSALRAREFAEADPVLEIPVVASEPR